MSRPTIIFVGADKGGVGKTTVTKVVLDYLRNEGLEFKPFDAETPKGNLKRFFSADTDIVDLEHSDGQMAVLDNVNRSKITVVDLAARQLAKTLTLLGEIGLLDMAKEGKVEVIVLHVIGSTIASFNEIEATAKAVPGARYFLVTNHINNTEYFGWDSEDAQKALGLSEAVINVPKLDEIAADHVEQAGLPFADFAKTGASFVMRGKVNHWLKGNIKVLAETLKVTA